MAQDEHKTAQNEPKTAQDEHLDNKSCQESSVLESLWPSWSKKDLKKSPTIVQKVVKTKNKKTNTKITPTIHVFGAILGSIFAQKSIQTHFVFWEALGTCLEPSCEASWLSLGLFREAWNAILAQPYSSFGTFSKTKVVAIEAGLVGFWRASWLILARFGTQNGARNSSETCILGVFFLICFC